MNFKSCFRKEGSTDEEVTAIGYLLASVLAVTTASALFLSKPTSSIEIDGFHLNRYRNYTEVIKPTEGAFTLDILIDGGNDGSLDLHLIRNSFEFLGLRGSSLKTQKAITDKDQETYTNLLSSTKTK